MTALVAEWLAGFVRDYLRAVDVFAGEQAAQDRLRAALAAYEGKTDAPE
jgi:hypothetical protein